MEINHRKNEFFVEIGGKKAVLNYKIDGSVMDIYSTFTPEELRGRGLAEKLTIAAFEFAKENKLRVMPTCPYVRDYFLKKHEEFEDVALKQ